MNLRKTESGVVLDQLGRAPLPLEPILGIGLNYREHAREQGSEIPTHPVLFMKNPCAASLHGEPIVIPRICTEGGEQVDFEGELAVIIGKHCRGVAESASLSHVLAYCCANDVSARWWQKKGSGGQFCRGKSFDSFCPLGQPVAAAHVQDPQSLRLRTRLNGVTMQDSSTGDMIFTIARLIADLSRGMTLRPGTVILTGTPQGVGMARNPPVYLKPGDTVEVEIDRVGTLRNPVTAE